MPGSRRWVSPTPARRNDPTRPAGGVTGARFKREGDAVISMIIVPNGENGCCQVLTACVKGYGKRTPLEDYPVKGRGTRGVINIDANDRNGDVVAMTLVVDDDQVMFITEKGILMRTSVGEIRQTGRNAAGVRLIKLDDGDRLVALCKVDADVKSEGADAETAPPEGSPAPAGPSPADGAAAGDDDDIIDPEA